MSDWFRALRDWSNPQSTCRRKIFNSWRETKYFLTLFYVQSLKVAILFCLQSSLLIHIPVTNAEEFYKGINSSFLCSKWNCLRPCFSQSKIDCTAFWVAGLFSCEKFEPIPWRVIGSARCIGNSHSINVFSSVCLFFK